MIFEERKYQTDAVEYAYKHYYDKTKKNNGLMILPTGSGKSVIIAKLIQRINVPTLILQPSIEILKQNYKKYISLGFHAEIYSAKAKMKNNGMVVFATPGSIKNCLHIFKHIRYVIVDECHYVSPDSKEKTNGEKGFGLYKTIIKELGVKCHGLTATPYRLCSSQGGAELRFLTLQKGTMFKDLIFVVQNKTLFQQKHLSELKYYKVPKEYFNYDESKLVLNKNNSDYTDESLANYHKSINFPEKISVIANGALSKGRKSILIFVRFLEEAREICKLNPTFGYIDGEMDTISRDRVIKEFTSGKIKVLVNSGVLTTGFDYPELECVIFARKTLSLALYYQIIGRAMRKADNKSHGIIIDACNNIDKFGKVEDLVVEFDIKRRPYISGLVKGVRKRLTNVLIAA